MDTTGCEIEDGVKERLERLGGKVVRKVSSGGVNRFQSFLSLWERIKLCVILLHS